MTLVLTKRRATIVTVSLLALAIIVGIAVRPSDESRIREQLTKLARAVRITEDDVQTNPIGRLAHVSDAFQSLFDRDVRVSIPELTTLQSGRRELEQLVTGAPRMVRTFEVDFSDVNVKLDDTHATALVGATAKVKALGRDGTKREDRRAVDFRFAKQDGEWIITTLSVWAKGDANPN